MFKTNFTNSKLSINETSNNVGTGTNKGIIVHMGTCVKDLILIFQKKIEMRFIWESRQK